MPLWRVCRRLWVAREKAGRKIESAAKPSNLWPSELLALALLMWSRIAKFRRCQRQDVPPPVYFQYVQQWHEWETNAIRKQMRKQLGNELHSPALLRRLLRKWRTLPEVQRAEAEAQAASDYMQLQYYCGFSLSKWKGFVEWRRAHRGFFKLLLAAWHHWASSHRKAIAKAKSAASRHKMTSMAQHFEVLSQHTAYRRRLNAATTVRLQRPTGGQAIALARRAAFALVGEDEQALAVEAFGAWRGLVQGRKSLRRFEQKLGAAHDRALLEMVYVRWMLACVDRIHAKRAQGGGEDGDAGSLLSLKHQLVDRWQASIGEYGWPIDSAATQRMHAAAMAPTQHDLAAAAEAAMSAAAAEAAAAAAEARARTPKKERPKTPKKDKGGKGRAKSPKGGSARGSDARGDEGPSANAVDPALPVEAAAAAETPEGSTEAGRLNYMPSYLMWQALVSLAPTVLHQVVHTRRRLMLPRMERMRDKRDDALDLLPPYADSRPMLLGMQGLMESFAADALRAAKRRADLALLMYDGESSAQRINSLNPRFTLLRREQRLRNAAPPPQQVGKERGDRRGGGGKGGKSGSKSARGRPGSPKSGRPGSSSRRGAHTPPPLPVRKGIFDEEEDDADDSAPEDAHLPPSVPRFCNGRPRPLGLPVLPWELSEEQRLALEAAANPTEEDDEPDKVAALSALRALGSSHIESNEGENDHLGAAVFDNAMTEALEQGVEGQQVSTGSALAISSSLAAASTYVPARLQKEAGEEDASDDGDDSDDAHERPDPVEAPGTPTRPSSADSDANSEGAAEESEAERAERRRSRKAAGESSSVSAHRASLKAMASIRMLMGPSSHLLPTDSREVLSPRTLEAQVKQGYQQAQTNLGEWAEQMELEELAKLKARCDVLGEDAIDDDLLVPDDTLIAGISDAHVASDVQIATTDDAQGSSLADPILAADLVAEDVARRDDERKRTMADDAGSLHGSGTRAGDGQGGSGADGAEASADGVSVDVDQRGGGSASLGWVGSLNPEAWEQIPTVAPEWEVVPSLQELAESRGDLPKKKSRRPDVLKRKSRRPILEGDRLPPPPVAPPPPPAPIPTPEPSIVEEPTMVVEAMANPEPPPEEPVQEPVSYEPTPAAEPVAEPVAMEQTAASSSAEHEVVAEPVTVSEPPAVAEPRPMSPPPPPAPDPVPLPDISLSEAPPEPVVEQPAVSPAASRSSSPLAAPPFDAEPEPDDELPLPSISSPPHPPPLPPPPPETSPVMGRSPADSRSCSPAIPSAPPREVPALRVPTPEAPAPQAPAPQAPAPEAPVIEPEVKLTAAEMARRARDQSPEPLELIASVEAGNKPPSRPPSRPASGKLAPSASGPPRRTNPQQRTQPPGRGPSAAPALASRAGDAPTATTASKRMSGTGVVVHNVPSAVPVHNAPSDSSAFAPAAASKKPGNASPAKKPASTALSKKASGQSQPMDTASIAVVAPPSSPRVSTAAAVTQQPALRSPQPRIQAPVGEATMIAQAPARADPSAELSIEAVSPQRGRARKPASSGDLAAAMGNAAAAIAPSSPARAPAVSIGDSMSPAATSIQKAKASNCRDTSSLAMLSECSPGDSITALAATESERHGVVPFPQGMPVRAAAEFAPEVEPDPPRPARDAWRDPRDLDDGQLPGWILPMPHTADEHRGPSVRAGAVRMVTSLPEGGDTSTVSLLLPQVSDGAGVSVGIGPDALSFEKLPQAVERKLHLAGYDSVQASVAGELLRVTAKSQPKTIKASLKQLLGDQETVETIIDDATGEIKPGSKLVFANGESVPLGLAPVPLAKLPGVVEQKLTESGYSAVQATVDPSTGTVHASVRSDVALVANLNSLPTTTLGHGNAAAIAPSSVVPLSNAVSIFLGREPCPRDALPAQVASKLEQIGYSNVKANMIGDTVHCTACSPVALSASISALPKQMVEHESSQGGKMIGINGEAVVVFSTGEMIGLGGKPCSIRSLPQVITKKLERAGYTDVNVRIDGDVLIAEALARKSLAVNIRGVGLVKHNGGRALPAGTTLTLQVGTAVELTLGTSHLASNGGRPQAALASSVAEQLGRQGYKDVHVELAGSTLLVEALLPAEGLVEAHVGRDSQAEDLMEVKADGAFGELDVEDDECTEAFDLTPKGSKASTTAVSSLRSTPCPPGISGAPVDSEHVGRSASGLDVAKALPAAALPNSNELSRKGDPRGGSAGAQMGYSHSPLDSGAMGNHGVFVTADCGINHPSGGVGDDGHLGSSSQGPVDGTRRGRDRPGSRIIAGDGFGGSRTLAVDSSDGLAAEMNDFAGVLRDRPAVLSEADLPTNTLVGMLGELGQPAPPPASSLTLELPRVSSQQDEPSTRGLSDAFRKGDRRLLGQARALTNAQSMEILVHRSGESSYDSRTRTPTHLSGSQATPPTTAQSQVPMDAAALLHLAREAGRHRSAFEERRDAVLLPQERLYKRQMEQMAASEARLAKAVAADRQHQIARAANTCLAAQLSQAEVFDISTLSQPKTKGARQRSKPTDMASGAEMSRPSTASRPLRQPLVLDAKELDEYAARLGAPTLGFEGTSAPAVQEVKDLSKPIDLIERPDSRERPRSRERPWSREEIPDARGQPAYYGGSMPAGKLDSAQNSRHSAPQRKVLDDQMQGMADAATASATPAVTLNVSLPSAGGHSSHHVLKSLSADTSLDAREAKRIAEAANTAATEAAAAAAEAATAAEQASKDASERLTAVGSATSPEEVQSARVAAKQAADQAIAMQARAQAKAAEAMRAAQAAAHAVEAAEAARPVDASTDRTKAPSNAEESAATEPIVEAVGLDVAELEATRPQSPAEAAHGVSDSMVPSDAQPPGENDSPAAAPIASVDVELAEAGAAAPLADAMPETVSTSDDLEQGRELDGGLQKQASVREAAEEIARQAEAEAKAAQDAVLRQVEAQAKAEEGIERMRIERAEAEAAKAAESELNESALNEGSMGAGVAVPWLGTVKSASASPVSHVEGRDLSMLGTGMLPARDDGKKPSLVEERARAMLGNAELQGDASQQGLVPPVFPAGPRGTTPDAPERVQALHALSSLLHDIEGDMIASDVRRKSGTPSRVSTAARRVRDLRSGQTSGQTSPERMRTPNATLQSLTRSDPFPPPPAPSAADALEIRGLTPSQQLPAKSNSRPPSGSGCSRSAVYGGVPEGGQLSEASVGVVLAGQAVAVSSRPPSASLRQSRPASANAKSPLSSSRPDSAGGGAGIPPRHAVDASMQPTPAPGSTRGARVDVETGATPATTAIELGGEIALARAADVGAQATTTAAEAQRAQAEARSVLAEAPGPQVAAEAQGSRAVAQPQGTQAVANAQVTQAEAQSALADAPIAAQAVVSNAERTSSQPEQSQPMAPTAAGSEAHTSSEAHASSEAQAQAEQAEDTNWDQMRDDWATLQPNRPPGGGEALSANGSEAQGASGATPSSNAPVSVTQTEAECVTPQTTVQLEGRERSLAERSFGLDPRTKAACKCIVRAWRRKSRRRALAAVDTAVRAGKSPEQITALARDAMAPPRKEQPSPSQTADLAPETVGTTSDNYPTRPGEPTRPLEQRRAIPRTQPTATTACGVPQSPDAAATDSSEPTHGGLTVPHGSLTVQIGDGDGDKELNQEANTGPASTSSRAARTPMGTPLRGPGPKPWASCTVRSCGSQTSADVRRIKQVATEAGASSPMAASSRQTPVALRSAAANQVDAPGSGVDGSDDLLDLNDEGVVSMLDSKFECLTRRKATISDIQGAEEELQRSRQREAAAAAAARQASPPRSLPGSPSIVASALASNDGSNADVDQGITLALDTPELSSSRRPRSFAAAIFEETGPVDSSLLDDLDEDPAPKQAKAELPALPAAPEPEESGSGVNAAGALHNLQAEFSL